jgi:hypothetical protein
MIRVFPGLLKKPALSHLGIHTQVYRFMAYRQRRFNLLRALLLGQQRAGFSPCPRIYACRVGSVLRSITPHLTGLFWPPSSRTSVATQLGTDGRFDPIKHSGYLRLVVSGFPEDLNAISFSLAAVFVVISNNNTQP